MAMQIIIPTKGRTNDQLTVNSLRGCGLIERTTLLAPGKEARTMQSYRSDWKVEAQPIDTWKIHEKRAWILQEWARRGHDKIIMLDDDLRFATRISKDDWHLKEIIGQELEAEFDRLEEKLGPEFPHVGFGPRQGNNTLTEVGWRSPGKICYTLGYYLPVVLKECELGQIHLREDLELCLQLLLKGYPNAVLTETVVDQRGFDKPGGTSTERTVEHSNAEALKLAAMYPGYVSTVELKYKVSLQRVEVIVQWMKALQDGQRARQAKEQAAGTSQTITELRS
jgi:hypothetical protein